MRFRFCLLAAVLALTVTPARSDASPARTLANLNPRQRVAFIAWTHHAALQAWYDAVAAREFNWPALSICETGGDFTAHGSKYSSAYGVLNQAVRENSPPDVAARILAGRASVVEQTRMAIALEHRHGIHAWSCWRAALRT